jgi:hypothetical protein
MGNTVQSGDVARLAGLRYVSEYKSHEGPNFDPAHFITRPLAGREKEIHCRRDRDRAHCECGPTPLAKME